MIRSVNMRKVLVVSHDAGGAEVVSSWVKSHEEYEYRFVLQGPAKNVFRRKIPSLHNQPVAELSYLICRSDFVLTGTSSYSPLEKMAIAASKQYGIRVASFLDHWTNYKIRFRLDNKLILPNELWVGDKYAFSIAKRHFPVNKIKLVPNPYFEEIKNEISKLQCLSPKNKKYRILYVCDPIKDSEKIYHNDSSFLGYDEFEALEYFLNHIHKIFLEGKIEKILIRPHPSEHNKKYLYVIDRYKDLPIAISRNKILLHDCSWANVVVGCETMALVVALLANKVIISCIPPGGKRSSLPHNEIIDFNKFLKKPGAIARLADKIF